MSLPKVLVTGGTGFLGSEIVKALVESKRYEVTAIDINPPALGTGTFSDVRYVRANILQKSELAKVFHEAKPTIVIHTVGITPAGQARYSSKGREALFEINVTGTRNVVEVSKECGAKGLVYTSSITVLVDENDRDFVNADETWPTGRAKLLYGQSKVNHTLLSRPPLNPISHLCSFSDVHVGYWSSIELLQTTIENTTRLTTCRQRQRTSCYQVTNQTSKHVL
jgi:nucleoside-diphosphate-sugar epimerase